MATEQITRNLAFVNWTVLAGLAVASIAAVTLLRLRSEATKGYLGFTALCAAAFGGLALLSGVGLPASLAAESPMTGDPAWNLPRRAGLPLTVAGSLLAALVLLRGGRASVLVAGPVVAGAGGPGRRRVCLGWGCGDDRAAGAPADGAGGGHRGVVRGDGPRPLVPGDAPPADRTGEPAVPGRPRGCGLPVRAVRGLDAPRGGRRTGAAGAAGAADRPVGAVRLAPAPRRAAAPPGRVVGGCPDGKDLLDGVGHRAPVHRPGGDRRRDDPRRRPVLRRRPSGLAR